MGTRCALLLVLAGAASCAVESEARERLRPPAQEPAPQQPKARTSEPLVVPLFGSNPKLATSAGLLAAYVYQLDLSSPSSRFGALGSYTTTDSWYAGAFADLFWDGDKNRLNVRAVTGEIRNDYQDFLGTGLPAQTTDTLRLAGGRYLRQLDGPWYAGVQLLATNYLSTGENALGQELLDLAGLTGIDSTGVGLVGQYDTRDNLNSPREGANVLLHNLSYREAFGGDEDFDVLTADARLFLPHGRCSTVGVHFKGRFTFDAPPSGYSSTDLRGYIRGQYLAEHALAVEIEERWGFAERWGAAAFSGLALLLGDGDQPDFADNLYPNIGVGMFRYLNDDLMVVRADVAFGVEGNLGFYLTFNQPF